MTVFTSPRPKISLLLTTFPGTKTFAETWPRAKALLKCKVKCKLHKLAYSSGGLSRRLKTIIYYDSLGWLIWASYWWLGLSLQLRMRRTFLILSKCVCCSNFTFARPLPHATFSDICALCADSIQIGKVASALQPSFLGFLRFPWPCQLSVSASTPVIPYFTAPLPLWYRRFLVATMRQRSTPCL